MMTLTAKTEKAAEKLEAALSIMEATHTLDEPDKTVVEHMIRQALKLLNTKSR